MLLLHPLTHIIHILGVPLLNYDRLVTHFLKSNKSTANHSALPTNSENNSYEELLSFDFYSINIR